MKRFLKQNLILLLVLAVGIVSSFVSIGARMVVESRDKTYDIVVDRQELAKMAEQSDHDELWWLKDWKQYGIDKVGVWEDSLASLADEYEGTVQVVMVHDLEKSNPDWKASLPASLNLDKGTDEFDVLCIVRNLDENKELFAFIRNAFNRRYPGVLTASATEGSVGYLYFDGRAEDALYTSGSKTMKFNATALSNGREVIGSIIANLNLGFRDEVVGKYTSIGYEIIPRTVSYDGFNDTVFAKDVIRTYESLPADPAYIIVGGSVYGLDDGTSIDLYNYIDTHDTSLCLIEATDQIGNIETSGLFGLSEALNDRVVRTYSVWDYIQYRYAYFGYEGPEEIQNTLYRAVTERNIRMVYWKPMKMTDEDYIYITEPDDYDQVFTTLEARLSKHGYSIGTAKPADYLTNPFVGRILSTLGAVAAAILVLKTIFSVSKKAERILLIIGFVGVIGCFFVAPNASALLGGFANAVFFPCLACALYMNVGRKQLDGGKTPSLAGSLAIGAGLIVAGSVIALVGGLCAASPFSTNSALVEQTMFRGIKFSQIIPMIYALVCYMAWFGFRKDKKNIGRIEKKDISNILMLDIKVWMVAVFLVLAGAAAIYIIRTGHTSNLNTNTLEVEFRNKLEEILPARPRTKEFLIAFPCLMLFIYACQRGYRFFMFCGGFGAVIGFACIANTYMHLRTPVTFSLLRLVSSVPMGIAIGAVCVVLFDLICRIWNKYIKEQA